MESVAKIKLYPHEFEKTPKKSIKDIFIPQVFRVRINVENDLLNKLESESKKIKKNN